MSKRQEGWLIFGYGPVEMYHNTLEFFYKVQGNAFVAKEIEDAATELFCQGIDLYSAQDQVVKMCRKKYGEEYAQKNRESILYLVEIKYADKLRETQPYVDSKEVHDYMHSSALY